MRGLQCGKILGGDASDTKQGAVACVSGAVACVSGAVACVSGAVASLRGAVVFVRLVASMCGRRPDRM